MMRLSISNLAWPKRMGDLVAPRLKAIGIDGVELAPTAIWPKAPHVPTEQVRRYADNLRAHGLAISGIQSLLYGHPEMQVFRRKSWPNMHRHLTGMIRLAHHLNTKIVVFGSPKNRVRGSLSDDEANEACAEFLSGLLPTLAECDVVLTLEPNAPAYGTDYLTRYVEAVALSDLIASPWIKPQIDTGCMGMVGESADQAISSRLPAHIHISMHNLLPPPGSINHQAIGQSLAKNHYDGWVVLEMLQASTQPLTTAVHSAKWFTTTYGSLQSHHSGPRQSH